MHPIIIHQVATFDHADMCRRAELHHARAGVRRPTGRHGISHGPRSWLGQAWALLTAFRSS